MKISKRFITVIAILNFVFTTFNSFSQYTNLHKFNDSLSGMYPRRGLYSDGTYLYGILGQGGIYNKGGIYKLKVDGTDYSMLHHFDSINGNFPDGALISDGTFLYGTTQEGGSKNLGVIYKIKPDGTDYSILFHFDSTINSSGINPVGTLIFDGTFLYGTTAAGGVYNAGTIYKIKSDGTNYSKLLDFGGIIEGGGPGFLDLLWKLSLRNDNPRRSLW